MATSLRVGRNRATIRHHVVPRDAPENKGLVLLSDQASIFLEGTIDRIATPCIITQTSTTSDRPINAFGHRVRYSLELNSN